MIIEDRIIVITPEHILPEEAQVWKELLKLGVGKIHVRKPRTDPEVLSDLVSELNEEERQKLVIHYYPNVAIDNYTGGFHLSFNKIVDGRILFPATTALSTSVHSWDEAKAALKVCSYCFMSPVFDSISKEGYLANPELSKVPESFHNNRIYALGGIDKNNISKALAKGYYGAALLGAIWSEPEKAVENTSDILNVLNPQLRTTCLQ